MIPKRCDIILFIDFLCTDEEGVLYAELDMSEVVRTKVDFDVIGHYARPDVFQLIVNEEVAVSVRNKA